MPTPIIRVAHLTKRFGAQVVVDDLSFEVAPGETLVLLGPSGCGKTTLLKTLNRLVEPDGGTIEINGRDVRQQRPEELRRGLGYVIQQVGLLPHLTVAQNVGVVPGLLGYPAAETAARTTELLNRLHLPAERFGPMLPAQLSGGQQQRVGLARALAADPPVVLLDEPFGALDPLTRAAVRRDFRELDELRRKTVVLVTHDVQEAFELADRIMLLNNGRIQQLGPPRELLLHPANDFVRSFFQAEQLALQLRVLTLADLAPYLPPPTAQPRQPVPPATSLGQVLSWLTSAPRPAAETGAAPQLADAATLAQGSPSPAEASTTQAGAPTTQVEASTGLAKASTIPFKVSTTPAEVSAREAEAPAGGAHGLTRRVEASAALAAAAAGPADASAFPGASAGVGPWGLAGPGATWQPLTLPLVLVALGELLASLSPAAPHADA